MDNFERTTPNFDIEYYLYQITNDIFTCPIWQRRDCWPLEYKQKLIESILKGIDIPKIYIGEIIDTTLKYIIDGGHRTRAISEFVDNRFHIKINGIEVMYEQTDEHNTRNRRSLTQQEKERFMRYELNITKYANINEIDCRYIFNILQNSQPMSVADVINSHQSYLVDYLRDLAANINIIGFENLNFVFNHYKGLPKPDNNESLYQLVSWFTIVSPILDEDASPSDDVESEVAMRYLEKGKTRGSKCLKYIRKHNTEIENSIRQNFVEKVIFIMDCLRVKPILASSDLNSLLYAYCWDQNFDVDSFYDFVDYVNEFIRLKNLAKKSYDENNMPQTQAYNAEKDELNEQFNGNLEIYAKSRTSGGSNEHGMRKRNDIIILHCCN